MCANCEGLPLTLRPRTTPPLKGSPSAEGLQLLEFAKWEALADRLPQSMEGASARLDLSELGAEVAGILRAALPS